MTAIPAQSAALFAPLFADAWEELHPVFQKRYAHRTASRDAVVLTGTMQFRASRLARWLSPLLRMGGMPPVFTAKDIPVTIRITGQGAAGFVHLSREIAVPHRKQPVRFDTFLQPFADGAAIDWTRRGSGWQCQYHGESGRTIRMRHRGYVFSAFGKQWRLPLERIIGQCHAWEKADDDNHFSMRMEMRRPNGALFYGYSGSFAIAGMWRKD